MMNEKEYSDFSLGDKETIELLKSRTRQALINQDIIALKRLGYNNDEIRNLFAHNAHGFERLMNLSNQFVSVTINVTIDHERFSDAITEAGRSLSDLQTIRKLISYHAPKTMMMSLLGISVERFKFWRCVYGLEKRGRAPAPTEQEKSAIWESWNKHQQLNLIDRMIAIYEDTGVPLRSVWAEIHTWEEHPDKYKAFDHKSRFILKSKHGIEFRPTV